MPYSLEEFQYLEPAATLEATPNASATVIEKIANAVAIIPIQHVRFERMRTDGAKNL